MNEHAVKPSCHPTNSVRAPEMKCVIYHTVQHSSSKNCKLCHQQILSCTSGHLSVCLLCKFVRWE